MSEWKTYKLGELCSKIGSGSTPKGGSNVYLESGEISLIRSQNIYNEGFNPNGIVYITQESADKLKNVIVNENDVLVNITGDSVARACIVDKKYLPARVNQHTAILRAIPNILDYRYLKNYLINKPIQDYLLSISSSGATRNALTKSMLENLEIQLPDIETQQKIGEFLETFNKKIQLNTQTNQTLEAIAQAIFKSWFVDFDPVRAKAQALSEGKSEREANLAAMSVICGKDTSELNDTEYKALWQIADAFPSELVENAEFGEVPKGWEISTIGESYNVIMGQSPSGETYNEQGNGTLFYQGRAEFGWRFPTPRLFTTNPKRMAKSNDILMSVRAPVGDLNVALENCCIGRGLCALSHKSGEFSFGFYQMKNLKSVLDVFNGEGTVFGSINQKDLKSIPVLNPHQEIIALFNKFIFDIDNKIKNNVKENQQLEKIRDLLLPKLLSGEMEL